MLFKKDLLNIFLRSDWTDGNHCNTEPVTGWFMNSSFFPFTEGYAGLLSVILGDVLSHWLLIVPLCIIFSARGVSYLFDIQVKSFNHVYDGEDVIAQARTGTGKTFSFAIPLVEKLQKEAVAPTRGRAPTVHTRTPVTEN